MSDSLWPHALWHARLLCPSLSPRVCSHSCPLSRWCYLTISSSVTPFSFCLWVLPASGCFPVSLLFVLGDQSFGSSALALVLPMNIQGWFPLGFAGLISLQSKGLSRVFSSATITKASVLQWSFHLLRYSNNPGGSKPEVGRFPKVVWKLRRIA